LTTTKETSVSNIIAKDKVAYMAEHDAIKVAAILESQD